ncbi:hypothetical protein DID80_04295 [Candidatus Marinamargulisbacteria bacterium SCGC AAA071-K20]|nr:hypothetical protein DID80_04295 [Candidatus Marinamargulisbacteria bacterium SCGC AAA071-K20]
MDIKEFLQTDLKEVYFSEVKAVLSRYQRYVYIVLAVCLVALIYYTQVKPKVDVYFQKTALLKQYNKLLKTKEKRIMTKDIIESEISRLQILVDEKENIFFTENDFNEFSINILPKMANSYDGKIKSIVYKQAMKKNNFLIYKLDLIVEGNFNGLINLYNDLELFSKVIKIEKFNIVLRKVNPLTLSTELSLSMYGVDE